MNHSNLLEDIAIRYSIPIALLGQQYNTKVHPGHCYPGYDTRWSRSLHLRYLQESANDDEDIVISTPDK